MDHYGRSALNCFAANSIDRLTVKRRDETWLAEQMEDPETLFVPVWDSKQLFTDEPVPNPVLLSRPGAGELLKVAETVIFLGKDETAATRKTNPAPPVQPDYLKK